jgi:hypothetical protein
MVGPPPLELNRSSFTLVLQVALRCSLPWMTMSWFLVCLLACASLFPPSTSDDPLNRCGLRNPSRKSLLAIACICFAYHALKVGINGEFSMCIPQSVGMTTCVIYFAQSFLAVAGEPAPTSTLYDRTSLVSCQGGHLID